MTDNDKVNWLKQNVPTLIAYALAGLWILEKGFNFAFNVGYP